MAPVYLLWKRCGLVSAVLLVVGTFSNPPSTIAAARSDKSAKKAPAAVTTEIPVLPLDNPARRNMIWLTTTVAAGRQWLLNRLERKMTARAGTIPTPIRN